MVHLTRTDEITGLWSYLSSIDWSEPWFLGLGVFHMMCSVITYSTRNCFTLQGIFFGIYLVIVASSEYLNEVAANYWRFFAKQQYFDSSGLFISVVLSIPLLINCLVIVLEQGLHLSVKGDFQVFCDSKKLISLVFSYT